MRVANIGCRNTSPIVGTRRFQPAEKKVIDYYRRRVDGYLGPNTVPSELMADLHDLQYLPLEVRSLPEGTHTPLRVPMVTISSTHKEFFWLPNNVESNLSNTIWPVCTSATIAYQYRKILDRWAQRTGGDPVIVPFQAHDFSMRGMMGTEATALSGFGHLLSFTGTDSLPTLDFIEAFYDPSGFIAGGVPATEHAVMCAGGETNEFETYARLLNLYPSGYLSIVSDTWDLWHVITVILKNLHNQIMSRTGKLVIRPDSGIPEDILCGDLNSDRAEARKGVVELLWDEFGGTVNAQGYKVLDSHIGAIYGDSITLERAEVISRRLAAKGFASTNVVLGVGSFTYQYVTRDTFGFAMKATYSVCDGKEHMLFKDPITDKGGVKKSARGLLAVVREDDKLKLVDGLDRAHYDAMDDRNLLRPVWRDGRFLKRYTLEQIRETVALAA
jgi:nicotinamide phosphoribosyltransferase